MNDKLAGFGSGSDNSSTQQRTHIEYFNPDHPENSGDESREYFQAAKDSKDWGGSDFSRKVLVGEFLVGVKHWVDNEDPDYLLNVVSTILERDVELADEE